MHYFEQNGRCEDPGLTHELKEGFFRKCRSYNIGIEKSDRKYLIYGMIGSIYFPKNFSNCLNEKKIVQNDIENNLEIEFMPEAKQKLFKDDTTMMYGSRYNFPSGDTIQIVCYNWSNNKEKNEYRTDELSISITSNEYNKWMDSISHLY